MSLRLSHKPNKGRTPHLYADNFIYFLTARTINQQYYLNTHEKKKMFIQIWNNLTNEYHIKTYHWVLWDNHYHALFQLPTGDDLPKFIQRLHGVSSWRLNKLDNTKGRKIWQQYWDHCIRNEVDFWKHFNYITNNPIKHGWCATLEEAFTYSYCANRQWVEKQGKNFLYEMIRQYPIQNFSPEEIP
ncbi:MAG: transposase, partial [Patescibacteria group bacterium]